VLLGVHLDVPPQVNAAAWQCTGECSMNSQVVPTNSVTDRGTPASFSAAGTGRPSRSRAMKVSMRVVSAPDWRMPSRYSSKWLMKPSPSSSLSSTRTMSLMSRRLPVAADGSHGTSTQVSRRCRDLSRDMKSHTANTWCSMNVTTASTVFSWW
jgi:hypothetical protein